MKRFDLLPDACIVCGASPETDHEPAHQDRLGLYWCGDHQYRGNVILWAYGHGWPLVYVEGSPCAVGPGMQAWLAALMWSSDEFAWLVSAYVEYLDAEALKKGA